MQIQYHMKKVIIEDPENIPDTRKGLGLTNRTSRRFGAGQDQDFLKFITLFEEQLKQGESRTVDTVTVSIYMATASHRFTISRL